MAEFSKTSSATSVDGGMPGEVARGLISLWLIVHLVGVSLAVFTQNELATEPGATDELSRSQLLHRVKAAPPLDQYLFALWLDVPYGYPLATGGLFDADHTIELQLIDADGTRREPIVWPSDSIWLGEQRERLARLAQRAHSDSSRGVSTLAAAIGRGILQQSGAKEVEISVYRRQPLTTEDARSSDAQRSDPRHERTRSRVYQATVRLDPNGDPEVKQSQEAQDVAPPTSRSDANPETNSTTPSADRPARRQQRAPPLPRRETDGPSAVPPTGIAPPSGQPLVPSTPFRQ